MVWNGRFISLTTLSLTQLQINLFFFNFFVGGEGSWHSSAQLVYATFHYAKSWWWGRRPHHQDFSGYLVSACNHSTDWWYAQFSPSLYWINSSLLNDSGFDTIAKNLVFVWVGFIYRTLPPLQGLSRPISSICDHLLRKVLMMGP